MKINPGSECSITHEVREIMYFINMRLKPFNDPPPYPHPPAVVIGLNLYCHIRCNMKNADSLKALINLHRVVFIEARRMINITINTIA